MNDEGFSLPWDSEAGTFIRVKDAYNHWRDYIIGADGMALEVSSPVSEDVALGMFALEVSEKMKKISGRGEDPHTKSVLKKYYLDVAAVTCGHCGNLMGDVYLAISRDNPEEFHKYSCVDRIKRIYQKPMDRGEKTCPECDMPEGRAIDVQPLRIQEWTPLQVAQRIEEAIHKADGVDMKSVGDLISGDRADLTERYRAMTDPITRVTADNGPLLFRVMTLIAKAESGDKDVLGKYSALMFRMAAYAMEEMLVALARTQAMANTLRAASKNYTWPTDLEIERFCDEMDNVLKKESPLPYVVNNTLSLVEDCTKAEWSDTRRFALAAMMEEAVERMNLAEEDLEVIPERLREGILRLLTEE